MTKHLATLTAVSLLILTSVLPVTARQVEAQATASWQESVEPAIGLSEVIKQYKAYGFVFEQYDDHDEYGRFTQHEIDVLGSVIVAYADWVGGPERLGVLVDGPVSVRKDVHEVISYTQADRVVSIGRGAFYPMLTRINHLYTWGARDEDDLARIVFGHEIGHRWIEQLRRQAAVDWADMYERDVWGGESASSLGKWTITASPEEEAVTNLALCVLGKSYRWTFLHDAPASERRQVWVDGWVSDLVANSE